MPLKPLLLAMVLTLAAFTRLSAQGLDAQSVVIEPPAPPSYSENRPAFMFFKKIEISPRSSGSYDITITLQEALPTTFPKDRGADFSVNFDFDEISPEKSLPTNRIPNFHEDVMIMLSRNVGFSKFETNPVTTEYHGRKWDIKVTNLIIRKDTISFSLRSPLFNLHPPCRVVFRSNYMRAQSATQSAGILTHETTPVSPDPAVPNAPK